MDDQLADRYTLIRQSVTDDGKTVTLFVRPLGADRYLLSILGQGSYITEWQRSFDSPEEALHLAMAAILERGIATFHGPP